MPSQQKANRTPRTKAAAQIRLISRTRKRAKCALHGCPRSEDSNGVCEKHSAYIERQLISFFCLGLELTELLATRGVRPLVERKGEDHPFIRRASIFLNQAATHWHYDETAHERQASLTKRTASSAA
jgi:hypothetical protein